MRRGALFSGLLVVLAVVALYLGAAGAPSLRAIEAQTLDWRFRLRGPLPPGPETVLVLIDDRSIAALGGWPISRADIATAVRAIAADGARVIALDFLFADARPDAPGEAEADRRLTAAIAEAGNVIVSYAFAFDSAVATTSAPPPAIARSAFTVFHLPPGQRDDIGLSPVGLVTPPEAFLAAGKPAHVSVLLDPDGALRHEHPVIAFDGSFYPSLPVEAVRLYRGLGKDRVVPHIGQGIDIGDRHVPTDGEMRLPVRPYGPAGSFETRSFVDLIDGDMPAGTFEDRIVLLGASALGVGDTFATAFTPQLPGLEHYAAVIDNILRGRFLVRQDWTLALDILAIVVCGALAAVTTLLFSPVMAGLAAAALLGAWAGLNQMVLVQAGVWLNLIFPAGAIVFAFLWFGVSRALSEQRRRRDAERRQDNLSRYVPAALAESLAESDSPCAGDREQRAAVMFVDIVGYTTMSETMAPERGMALLRGFHGLVEQAVQAHGGVLHQIMGDGAMASFGPPEPTADDACKALDCARALAADVARWGEEHDGRPIRIGIGLHYGTVMVGSVGGARQLQFTLIGDTVNVASRLESLTRQHRATIVASDALIAAAREAGGEIAVEGFVPLPDQTIRGRERPIGAWAWPGQAREKVSPDAAA